MGQEYRFFEAYFIERRFLFGNRTGRAIFAKNGYLDAPRAQKELIDLLKSKKIKVTAVVERDFDDVAHLQKKYI